MSTKSPNSSAKLWVDPSVRQLWVDPEIRELKVRETFHNPGSGADGDFFPDCSRS